MFCRAWYGFPRPDKQVILVKIRDDCGPVQPQGQPFCPASPAPTGSAGRGEGRACETVSGQQPCGYKAAWGNRRPRPADPVGAKLVVDLTRPADPSGAKLVIDLTRLPLRTSSE